MNLSHPAILGLLLAAAPAGLRAQDGQSVDLKGTVSGTKDGAAIAGAAVRLALYPEIHAVTDASGKFSLQGTAVGVRARAGFTEPTPGASRYPGHGPSFRLDGDARSLFDAKGRALPAQASASRSLARPLAKGGEGPDTLIVTKAGYRTHRKVLEAYAGASSIPVLLAQRLAPGKVKVYGERDMPSIDWGKNVEVHNWDGSTILKGTHPEKFEGDKSWLVQFDAAQSWSGWAYAAKAETPEDLSAWKDGYLHLAIKGTVPNVGVMVISPDLSQGANEEADLASFGYKPDGEWHEIWVPMSTFASTDFSRVSVYCAFTAPTRQEILPFDPALQYMVDDIYYSLTR